MRAASKKRCMTTRVEPSVVGETYFFREPEQLAHLAEVIIPEILDSRTQGHVLSVWSAGCASGEEAYTLAIILEEMGLIGRASIIGTDVSPHYLSRAIEAQYRPWSFRGVGEERIAKS